MQKSSNAGVTGQATAWELEPLILTGPFNPTCSGVQQMCHLFRYWTILQSARGEAAFYTLLLYSGSSDQDKALKSFAKLVPTALHVLNSDICQMFATADTKSIGLYGFPLVDLKGVEARSRRAPWAAPPGAGLCQPAQAKLQSITSRFQS